MSPAHPPARASMQRRQGRMEDYAELTREQHHTLEHAAARLGISERTAWRYEARLRAAGIPRSTYESGRLGVHATQPAAPEAVAV